MTSSSSLTTAKWTLEQYHQMIDAGILDEQRVELLNGEIVEIPPEGEPHAFYSHTDAKYIEQLLGDRVEVLQGKPITIRSSNSEPEPDIAVVQPLGREYLQHHPYPENIFWLIEFSNSSLKKDLDPKAKVYAAAGIREYWVVNVLPEATSGDLVDCVNLKVMELIVMRDPVEGEYQSQITLAEGIVTPLAFSDVTVSVRQLLD